MRFRPLWVFLPTLVLSVLFRFYLKTTIIDPSTGFYQVEGVLTFTFAGLLALGSVAVLYTWLRGCRENPTLPLKGSILLGCASILLGLVAEFSSYRAVVALLNQIGGNSRNTIALLTILFGCLSCLVFVVQGVLFIRKKPPLNTLVLTIPTLWQICYFLSRFTGYTTLRVNSEYQLFVAFFFCNLLFFMGSAGFLSGIAHKYLDRTVVFGYASALMAFALTIPHFAGVFLGKIPMAGAISFEDLLLCAATGLYTGLFAVLADCSSPLIAMEKKKKRAAPPTKSAPVPDGIE